MNGVTLAYLGDAYYELVIREYLVNQGFGQVKTLHNKAIKYTSSLAQATIIDKLIDSNSLTEEEISIYKRGRNNSSSGRKNVDAKTYTMATGFEALIGFLYINDKNRLKDIIDKAINIVEKGARQ